MPLVALTLSEGALAGLDERLAAGGHEVRRVPLLTFEPPPSFDALDVALVQSRHYAAVAVTSPRAAAALAERVRAGGHAPLHTPVWTVGERTAAPLREICDVVRVVTPPSGGEQGAAEALATEMLAARVRGAVLFPCGALRRDALPRLLAAAGCRVDEVLCYRTVLPPPDAARAALGRAQLVVVGSPSVAELLAGAVPIDERPLLVAVGPTTGAAAEAAGWIPDATSERPTVDAIAGTCLTLLHAGHFSS
ncbi:MAG TPA: uroporphyrinogen-III synthase [Gemmatimonadales bacterium]|nr:uroporphyrinogen-III synthase [Gemmatimonadales bacterium]